MITANYCVLYVTVILLFVFLSANYLLLASSRADLFEATIRGKLPVLNLLEENIDTLTWNIHGAVIDVASEVLGKARKKKRPWATNDIRDLCDKRREASRKDKR